jgi:hypothetical protein
MAHEQLEQRIRERAFQLWIADGQPFDKAEEHWEKARTEVEAKETPETDIATPRGTSFGS